MTAPEPSEVRLTEDERNALRGLGQGQVPAAVERILAARLAEVTAERDANGYRALALEAERDALRAQVEAVAALAEGGIEPGTGEPLPEWVHTDEIHRALSDPAQVLAAHDAEVAARALEGAAQDFAEGAWTEAYSAGEVTDDESAARATDAWLRDRAWGLRDGSAEG